MFNASSPTHLSIDPFTVIIWSANPPSLSPSLSAFSPRVGNRYGAGQIHFNLLALVEDKRVPLEAKLEEQMAVLFSMGAIPDFDKGLCVCVRACVRVCVGVWVCGCVGVGVGGWLAGWLSGCGGEMGW